MTPRTGLFALALLPAILAAQTPPAVPLVITSPAQGSYVTGPVLLQARPAAPADVRSLTFYADGRSVCTVVRPPFECNWDAGEGLREPTPSAPLAKPLRCFDAKTYGRP